MAPSQSDTERPSAAAEQLLDRLDAVYFLPFPDWEKELRSNRWHYATRWARRKPVVLLNPVLGGGPSKSVSDPTVPNLRILRIRALTQRKLLASRHVQLGQVFDDMDAHGFSSPLLWSYNPSMLHVYAEIPAVVRVHHATEAFFDMPSVTPEFRRRLGAMIAISDVTIAVSDGVRKGVLRSVGDANVATIANGCDYRHYAGGTPDAELRSRGKGFERIAIYAGNVNDRLNFTLFNRLVDAHRDVLFAVYGPKSALPDAEEREWRRLVAEPNVYAPGAVQPDRLRDLYAAADVGLIPYRQDDWLVENGLPLKALEMCATGLPVVSSLMNSLQGLAGKLVVTSSGDEFVEAFERTSRTRLSRDEAGELAAVSSANDYDVKFEQVLEQIATLAADAHPTTRMDRMAGAMQAEWIGDERRFARWLAMSPATRLLEWSLSSAARVVPARVKRRFVPDRLRTAAQQMRGS